jgi:pimeloyl-ACP methyl ester carboxylesterase
VVGLSFGGAIAIALAQRRPALVRSLVLAGAYAGWRGSLETAEVEERLRYSLAAAELSPDRFVETMLPSMFAGTPPEGTLADFAASMRDFSPVGFRTMAQASAEADLRAGLGAITAPTLLLYGDRDERAPLRVANRLLAAIPDSRLVVLPGVGHESAAEAPHAFTRELATFLDEVDPPRGVAQ